MHDHRTVFGTVERDYWAEAAGLKPDERALIERYLDRDASTLEAGTGGGRILGEMRARIQSLAGFDFVPELIAEARRNEPSGEIGFDVQDATRLTYPDASFDQVIYLQQLLSSIEDAGDRDRVLAEAFRILKSGGDGAVLGPAVRGAGEQRPHRPYLIYLRALRRLGRVAPRAAAAAAANARATQRRGGA